MGSQRVRLGWVTNTFTFSWNPQPQLPPRGEALKPPFRCQSSLSHTLSWRFSCWSLISPALTKPSCSQCHSSYRYLLKRWSYSLKVFVVRAFSLEELALVLLIPNASGPTLLQNSSRPLVPNITGETLPFPFSDLLTASGSTDKLGKSLSLLFDLEALSWGRRSFFKSFV